MGLQYKGFIIHPKIARELDEILAGNSPNSNDKDRNDRMYHSTINQGK